jgi:hypothetical protein
MGYVMAAWLHAVGASAAEWARSRDGRGQGTVEYVGVVVMVTLLIGAVAVAAKGWAPAIGGDLRKVIADAIDKASGGI